LLSLFGFLKFFLAVPKKKIKLYEISIALQAVPTKYNIEYDLRNTKTKTSSKLEIFL